MEQCYSHTEKETISMQEFTEATQEDECIQLAITAFRTGRWHEMVHNLSRRTEEARHTLATLHHVRQVLSVSSEGCLFRGLRLVVPQSLQLRIVGLEHAAHQGIVKTKARLRCKVWFPGLD
ncbi:hypothetical protein NDU88_003021 [Pleurodeles waltl]|uniref:Uncharacterized protein n=1 Tax=Pleurodeles waltl TaxID=8319 RepID=A0AAV7V057_PLEWA|nr:hypothetical protein NDU88_003021 [Pleurodeles waltl]